MKDQLEGVYMCTLQPVYIYALTAQVMISGECIDEVVSVQYCPGKRKVFTVVQYSQYTVQKQAKVTLKGLSGEN